MGHDTGALVAEFRSSGMTQKRFCAKKRIAVSALQYHLSKFRRHKREGAKKDPQKPIGQFIPLQLQQTSGEVATIVIVRGTFGRGELSELLRAVAA